MIIERTFPLTSFELVIHLLFLLILLQYFVDRKIDALYLLFHAVVINKFFMSDSQIVVLDYFVLEAS